jgi:putative redox protein
MNLSLVWRGGLKFVNGPVGPPIELDSAAANILSPVQTLGYALMGCMGMDVAHMLAKGHHTVAALSIDLTSARAPQPPRRIVSVDLHVSVVGDVPEDAVARAIDLSREKYCSVWHSMRQDIQITTTFTVRPHVGSGPALEP